MTSNDQSNADYDAGNEIIYNTEVLKSNLCDYNNAYILVTGDITIVGDNGADVPLKNCDHSLNVSQKLMKQQMMILKT